MDRLGKAYKRLLRARIDADRKNGVTAADAVKSARKMVENQGLANSSEPDVSIQRRGDQTAAIVVPKKDAGISEL